jgi:hypothetical protein
VSFEALPVWLWTLRPKEWSQIFITGPDEAQLCQAHPELHNILVEKFTIVMAPPIRDSRCRLADVWWVSGREPYLQGLALPSGLVQVIWAAGVGRRLPVSLVQQDTNWTSINHSRIGGVTNARGWFGVKGLSPLTVPSDLTRTLSHVLKHSIRGTPCLPTTSATHYTPFDRLSVRDIASSYSLPFSFLTVRVDFATLGRS